MTHRPTLQINGQVIQNVKCCILVYWLIFIFVHISRCDDLFVWICALFSLHRIIDKSSLLIARTVVLGIVISVMVIARKSNLWGKNCCKFTTESDNERILFWKSVNVWGSYGQEFSVLLFWLTVYIVFVILFAVIFIIVVWKPGPKNTRMHVIATPLRAKVRSCWKTISGTCDHCSRHQSVRRVWLPISVLCWP